MFKQIKPAIWGAFLLVSLVIATIQPPFQVPDEFDHLKRAYLLSNGEIFLGQENGITGGQIDSGLLEFMSNFGYLPFHPESKITDEVKQSSSSINWSGEKTFSGLPNTAVYFPAIYIPQAFFIKVSKFLGFNINNSYILIKFGCIFTTFLLFLCANKILETPVFTIGFLVMPMALAMIGSTHPEPFSYGLVMIVSALFIRSFSNSDTLRFKSNVAMLTILFVLGTYRIYLLPMFLMPLILAWKKRDIKLGLISSLIILMAVSWIFYASKTVVGFRIDENTTANVVANHSVSLINMVSIFWNTILNLDYIKAYLASFVGVIGWLDAPLPLYQYFIIGCILIFSFILSIEFKKINNYFNFTNLILFLCSIASCLLMFVILILTVTKHSSEFVQGVQGRYFIPVVLMFSYISIKQSDGTKIIGQILLVLLLALTSAFTTNVITQRYYVSSLWNNNVYVVGNADININFGPLTSGRTFEQPFVARGTHLEAARLKLATYNRVNSGLLFFEIIDTRGSVIYKSQNDLSKVKDNDWFLFKLNDLNLIQGQDYKIRLSTMPYNIDSITWWANAKTQSHSGIIIDGKKQSGVFAYQLLFKIDAT